MTRFLQWPQMKDLRWENRKVTASAKPDAIVLHCLPAHREQEITEEVFEQHAKEIFEQAENRIHAQKAIMVLLMKDAIGSC